MYQGAILPPKLLSLYVNNLSSDFNRVCLNIIIDDISMHRSMYDDALCLMTPTGTAIQELFDIYYNFVIENDILFDPLKYICIMFRPKKDTLYCPLVNIVHDAKYLGFVFCNSKKRTNT